MIHKKGGKGMQESLFKERFNILYEESSMTQEEFGKMFNASKSQVFHWRNGSGEPDTATLAAIATTCNVTIDWLVGKSNTRTQIQTVAAHRTDDPMSDLPPEALERVEEFKELMRLKYGKKPT
jgi:transcriptional regulator with XRE-family HTH domain